MCTGCGPKQIFGNLRETESNRRRQMASTLTLLLAAPMPMAAGAGLWPNGEARAANWPAVEVSGAQVFGLHHCLPGPPMGCGRPLKSFVLGLQDNCRWYQKFIEPILFYFSFPSPVAFIFSSCHIIAASVSSMTLNQSSDRG